MNGRVLGVLGLVLALVASGSAWDDGFNDDALLGESCGLQYQFRVPCVPGVHRIGRLYCSKFKCCWDPEAPPNALRCYRHKDISEEALLKDFPELGELSDDELLLDSEP